MRLESILARAAAPLKHWRHASALLERHLGLSLSDAEREVVKAVCAASDAHIGAYYYWYFQKLLISRQVRRLSSSTNVRTVLRMDVSDYTRLYRLPNDGRGLLLATPHHGHYIFSIVAAAERLSASRDVLVFYGNPETHAGNEIFDRLHQHLFSREGSRVTVIHDTRAGLARALRGLQNGAAVIIMPDAFKNEHDTLLIPFCGRPMNVMLGTAALARKTNARILPMTSRPTDNGLGFASVFGEVIEPTAPDLPAEDILHGDYRVTLQMFEQFESVMATSLLHWQFIRSHFGRQGDFPRLPGDRVASAVELLFADPRVQLKDITPVLVD
jgi:lauroyl/myristoyl acyltransferase